jgi:hypothetical protein
METLKKEIYALLSVIAPAHYELAPDASALPCLVFKFDQYNYQNMPRIDAMLEVQVVDKSDGTSVVDGLANDVLDALHKRLVNKPEINIKIYFEDRTELVEADERKLKARQLRFSLQVYNY